MNILTRQQLLLNEVTTLLDKCDELDRKKMVITKDICAKLREIQTLNNLEQEK